ncbi:MAG: hypothetical protein WDZ91_01830 [Paenibacillaceae bacterium]
MIKSAKAIIVVQTPLGGAHNIGMNASLQEKLGAEGVIKLVRGDIRKNLNVELLSLEGDIGKELRISPAVARQFSLMDSDQVILSFNRQTKILRLREVNAK